MTVGPRKRQQEGKSSNRKRGPSAAEKPFAPAGEVPDDGRIQVCAICRVIPREITYYHALDVPNAVFYLEPKQPIQQSGPRKCPMCGKYYHISFSEEYWSPTEGMGVDTEIVVRRLSVDEALTILKDGDLEELKKTYDAQIRKSESNLSHPEKYLREDAAAELTLHFSGEEDWEKIRRLLKNPDESVRLTALNTTSRLDLSKLSAMVDLFDEMLGDSSYEIKRLACSLLFKYRTLKKDDAGIARLINGNDPVVKAMAFYLARSGSDHDIQPFVPVFQESLNDADEKLRNQAIYAITDAIHKNMDIPRNFSLLVGLLSDKNGNIREKAACAIKGVIGKGDLNQVLPSLIRLLPEKGMDGYYALKALKNAARTKDISPAFPTLVEMVIDKSHSRRQEAFFALQNSIEGQIHFKKDLSPIISLFRRLLSDANETMRRTTTDAFKMLISKHCDISEALPEIMNMLTAPKISYIESYFTQDVCLFLVKKGDWGKIEQLLKADSGISAAASRILTESARRNDIFPAIPALVSNLSSPTSGAREDAANALQEFARQKNGNPGIVIDAIEKSGIDNGDAKILVKKIGEDSKVKTGR